MKQKLPPQSIYKNCLQRYGKWRHYTLLLSSLMVTVCLAHAQQSINLGPTINSIYDDINPVLSPDRKILFFVRVNHPENKFGPRDSQDIWWAEAISDTTWARAIRAKKLNISRYNAVLAVFPDGQQLLLNGVFNKNGTFWKKRGLSISTREGSGWSKPIAIQTSKIDKKNLGRHGGVAINANGDVIILSMSRFDERRKNDLYIIEKQTDGKWTEIKKLRSLNTSASEEAPSFKDKEGKTLFFASNRGGSYSIFQTHRTGPTWTEWTAPEPSGPSATPISAKGGSSYPYPYFGPKDKDFYYSSTDQSIGKADIFRFKITRPIPIAVIQGRLLVKNDSTPLPSQAHGMVLLDGVQDTSVIVNVEEATYTARLKIGKTYQLTLQADSYQSIPSTVNLVGLKTDEEIPPRQLDLFVLPPNRLTLHGVIYNEKTGEILSPEDMAQIAFNGLDTTTTLTLNEEEATYSVVLTANKTYLITVTVPNFFPKTQSVMGAPSETLTRDIELSPVKKDEKIQLKNILFVYGKAQFMPSSYVELNDLLIFMKENPQAQILIAGHTDNSGSDRTNNALSQRRADAVKNYLMSENIETHRFKAKGYGSSVPVASNETTEGRQLNRRVEIIILQLE